METALEVGQTHTFAGGTRVRISRLYEREAGSPWVEYVLLGGKLSRGKTLDLPQAMFVNLARGGSA